ncbi:hypothetical protein CR513_41821, partial [Mucuna pruriens]
MNTRWDPRRAKLFTYTKRTKSKAVESKIETLELQNQDLKGEVSQLKEQMAQMFQILSQTNAIVMAMANHGTTGHAQAGNTASPPPYAVRDSPYGMPYEWNVETPANEEQEQLKTEAQHQVLRTTQPLVVYRQTPSTGDKWLSLEERLRAVEGGNGFGLEAVDLCLILDVDLPVDFKTPKFDKYKGSSCPRVHLAMYCKKMAAYIYDDKILDSLMGAVVSWYVNLEWGHAKTWRDLVEAFLK